MKIVLPEVQERGSVEGKAGVRRVAKAALQQIFLCLCISLFPRISFVCMCVFVLACVCIFVC